MIQIVSKKNSGSLKNFKELIFLQQTKVLVLTTQKRDVLWMEKMIWKSLLGEKYLLGKSVYFSVKNTVNKTDTWGFI